MGFSKIASALIVDPETSFDRWSQEVRDRASVRLEFGARKASNVIGEYDPSRYMLSHATIVASVDTKESSEPLGRHMLDGVEIHRKYSDYLVTPETEKYINDNKDCFERKLLLASFKTFVGGESYVEHMQIPALSKGKIIDAVARDVGDSVYIDILVANDLKHKPLIQAIKTGELDTLSMGATVAFTICTICGNVAEDETQLCSHIKNFKGAKFVLPDGTERIAAEICGHVTDPESCRFIEASWVANPAFKGAVLRNVLNPPANDSKTREKIQTAFSLPQVLFDPFAWSKAASSKTAFPSRFSNPTHFPRTPVTSDESSWTHAPKSPQLLTAKDDGGMEPVIEEYYQAIRTKVQERLKQELDAMNGEGQPKLPLDQEPSTPNDPSDNEGLIQTAFRDPRLQRIANQLVAGSKNKGEGKRVLLGLLLILKKTPFEVVASKTGLTGKQILRVCYIVDRNFRKIASAGMPRLYDVVLRVGGTHKYHHFQAYIRACESHLGRKATPDEQRFLIQRGKILSIQPCNLLIPPTKARTPHA